MSEAFSFSCRIVIPFTRYTLLVVLSSENMRVLKWHKVFLKGDSQTLPRWYLPPDQLLTLQDGGRYHIETI